MTQCEQQGFLRRDEETCYYQPDEAVIKGIRLLRHGRKLAQVVNRKNGCRAWIIEQNNEWYYVGERDLWVNVYDILIYTGRNAALAALSWYVEAEEETEMEYYDKELEDDPVFQRILRILEWRKTR